MPHSLDLGTQTLDSQAKSLLLLAFSRSVGRDLLLSVAFVNQR